MNWGGKGGCHYGSSDDFEAMGVFVRTTRSPENHSFRPQSQHTLRKMQHLWAARDDKARPPLSYNIEYGGKGGCHHGSSDDFEEMFCSHDPVPSTTTVSVHRGVLSEPCGSARSPRNIAATPRPFRSLRNTPFLLRPGLAVRLSMIRTWSVHGPLVFVV